MIISTNTQPINYHNIPRTVVSTQAHSRRKRHQGCARDWSERTDAMLHSRPRHVIYVIYCVSPVFAIYATCVIRYSPDGRPYRPRGRASAVTTISTCIKIYVIIYCPPTNLCEKGWGYHCCVLVWLLALFAKLN